MTIKKQQVWREQLLRLRADIRPDERSAQSRAICRSIIRLTCQPRLFGQIGGSFRGSPGKVSHYTTGLAKQAVPEGGALFEPRGLPDWPGRLGIPFKIAVFLPFGDEPDLWPAWAVLATLGFALYAPRVLPNKKMGWAPLPVRPAFCQVFRKGQLEEGSAFATLYREAGLNLRRALLQAGWSYSSYGILEPPAADCREAFKADLVFTPCVGVDRSGGRIGYGGGYYDRFLASIVGGREGGEKSWSVAVCYEEQLQKELPQAAWDQKVDGIIAGRKVWML